MYYDSLANMRLHCCKNLIVVRFEKDYRKSCQFCFLFLVCIFYGGLLCVVK